jgi:hypothetical protein
MYSFQIISQNKYIKVIEVFGERYVNVKKSGQRIIINGEHYYKLLNISNQSITLALN